MIGVTDLFRFIISIPVADRPHHLRNCLESIAHQQIQHRYAGQVTVVVAEDSREPQHLAMHRRLVAEYCARGLEVVYFDLAEQYQILQSIPEAPRRYLGRLLTTQPADRFYRKGQAANRNLSYLKLSQLTQDRGRTLYYFVDSDQSFLPELDYFGHINRIFQTRDIAMLTGKLVGDPPVSPAVMAANFLDDVTLFLREMAGYALRGECRFHRDAPVPGDAAYHDMAHLFGFDQQPEHFDYRCPLIGFHDHAACLATFVERLPAFFFGEHLTRKTAYQPGADAMALSPARTVYPGNYIVNFAGLKYIIPFGHLRLRMSGPTAGRLIQAEIGERFASANLPMLHRRMRDEDDGFRPGVEKQDAAIDIADELERQFFGDVMLFAVVEWLQCHDLAQLTDGHGLPEIVGKVETELLALYRAQHGAVNARRLEIEAWVKAHEDGVGAAIGHGIEQFLRNIEMNFGDKAMAWMQIGSASHRQVRRQQIVDALMYYPKERAVWDRMIAR